ncbi:MAG: FAD-binding oxidoreductase [Burkholderiaceae bacterium]|nr:FAD-binding oxidoreductase [Burkholderiaceae bacterium]
MPEEAADHAARVARLQAQLVQAPEVRLAKRTSNLFRDRVKVRRPRLDVRDLDHVLAVDADAGYVDAEGMVPYDALTDACLVRGVMPAVVPELKSITLGGGLAGVGIEATSFRHGLVHETVLEFDVLVGTGEVITAHPDGAHADLFYGFPNSYGTLGYALRVRARTIPVQPFVAVEHRRFNEAARFFEALAAACAGDADFVDAVVFDAGTLVLNVARFVAQAPYASDYTFERMYWRSLLERELDYLTVRDYIWRWDTDWFWCSKNVGAQHPLLRRLFGRARLNSRTYTKLMRLNSQLRLTPLLDRLRGWHRESVIQDVDIPLPRAPEFLDWYLREIGILPLWLCPIGATACADRFPLFPRQRALSVTFGFWDVNRTRQAYPPGHFNRAIERKVMELGGIKSLYSDSYFSRVEFDAAYGGAAYAALKARYDPQQRFADLYAKCVLRH